MTATDQPARNDNLFGVCAAVGEDFGFDPLWLRIAFAVALLFDLEHVLMAYAALGALVLVSRLAFRTPKRTAVATPAAAEVIEAPEYRKAA
ncbi:PspC domain-containing protein [Sphingomonas adhaesiva]|uniref:PspC domain-containing protein n=1 Tax=Sphingomonas adhaesiva TaxID=28212 RepID=UPI002FF50B1A